MKNIVIYARYSSEKQTEQSIEGQLRVCHEFAERNDYKIIHEYIDRALSGKNDNRPAFQQMIEDSKNKEFEYVLVYKLDRFSRSKYDNAIYKHMLQLNGVRVISAMESISNTPEGALMEGLLEMFAEMYSKDLSQKVKRGMYESLLKGNFIGGYVLYGYKVVDKKLVIDETKAPAIRYLFEEYAKGTPSKEIIKELNDRGFRNYKGKPLSYNNIRITLNNKKYMGVFDNGEFQSFNYCPAIIDKELFERCQQKLQSVSKAPARNKAKTEYILTGKLFCGKCGSSMVGVSGTSRNGVVHNYYACSNRWKSHACDKKHEKKEDLEMEILKSIKKNLNKKTIDYIATNILKQYGTKNTNRILQQYQNQLNNIEKQLDKCFENFYNTTNVDFQKRMNEKADSLTLQKKDLEKEIRKTKLALQMQRSKADIIEIITTFVDGDIHDRDYQKRLVDNFISSIYLYDNEIVVYLTINKVEHISFERLKADLKNNDVLISNNSVHQFIKPAICLYFKGLLRVFLFNQL